MEARGLWDELSYLCRDGEKRNEGCWKWCRREGCTGDEVAAAVKGGRSGCVWGFGVVDV